VICVTRGAAKHAKVAFACYKQAQSRRWFCGDPRKTRCCAADAAQAAEDGPLIVQIGPPISAQPMELGADQNIIFTA
jgi:hypothetical protein